ncbi:hypothetical protein HON22_00375 [Candidatus Peregrinibacteria bacterium]|jgi:hypothetical protein|nr:hypothetical protein [Candidatus Peregrinibacteria bacterium]
MKRIIRFIIVLCLLTTVAHLTYTLHKERKVLTNFILDNRHSFQYTHKGEEGEVRIFLKSETRFKICIGEYTEGILGVGTGFRFYAKAESDAMGELMVSLILKKGDVVEFLPYECPGQAKIQIIKDPKVPRPKTLFSYRSDWWKLQKMWKDNKKDSKETLAPEKEGVKPKKK